MYPVVIRRAAVALLVLASCAATEVKERSPAQDGPPYEILQVAEIKVGDGSRVLMVTYRASALRDYDDVRQAGIDLLPTFAERLEAGAYDALAIRAQYRITESDGAYTAKNFTVVFQEQGDNGEWVPLPVPR
jgi:hypothetical protein